MGKRGWARTKGSLCRSRSVLRAAVALQALILVAGFASNSFASPTRPAADADGDGLIEIYDLQDLHAMRAAPDGDQIYGSSSGCPTGGCTGFQLQTDLSFDINNDQVIDDDDDLQVLDQNNLPVDVVLDGYWEAIPIFSGTFDGNGKTISYLPRPASFDPYGLFSQLDGAQVFNLRFRDVSIEPAPFYTGTLAGSATGATEITKVFVESGSIRTIGEQFMGGLLGGCENSTIIESISSIDLEVSGYAGGLIGEAFDCIIVRSFANGKITSSRYHKTFGGLVGYADFVSIANSYFTGSVGEGGEFGGLIGLTDNIPLISNSFVSGALVGNSYGGGSIIGVGEGTFLSTFYSADTTGYAKTRTGGDEATGVTLADLQCPVLVGDTDCAPGLFAGWDTVQNSDNQPAWDFGTAEQVPALRIAGVVYRDSDGDGVFDADDQFPFDWAGSVDSDGDGAIDYWREGCDEECRSGSDLVLDQFPDDEDVSLDLDLDGFPDAWNPSCDATCQAASDWSLDPSLDDLDNDGLDDFEDQDDDGVNGADIDMDSNNLIEVGDLHQLFFIHYDLTGASRKMSESAELGDTSGCRPRIIRGVLARECDGFELMADLDFDTNGDGDLDEDDLFWDEGKGWEALGHLGDVPTDAFQTNFEGHGHTIANVYSNRGSQESGLFGGIRGANIRNLGVIGPHTFLTGQNSDVGGLIGAAENSVVTNCYSTGVVDYPSGTHAGGLVGVGEGLTIIGSFATGSVTTTASGSSCKTGGLVGDARTDSRIVASFASGHVTNNCDDLSENPSFVGGLIGRLETGATASASFSIGEVSGTAPAGGLIASSETDVVSSYWAIDTSGLSTSAGNAQGVDDVEDLACPTEANDTACVSGVSLFTGWDGYAQAGGIPYWEFGTSSELPGLCMGGTLHRVNSAGVLQPETPCACTATESELVANQGFEANTSGWTALASSIATSTLQAHTGSRSLRITGRSQDWSGAEYNLLGSAVPGETLEASAWMRIEGALNEPVVLTLRHTCQGGATDWTRIAERAATNNRWVKLSGSVDIPNCNLSELVIYAEGPSPGIGLYVDDVSVQSTSVSCSGSGGTGNIDGGYVVQSSWPEGYCVEVVIANPTTSPTTNWSATIDLNGTTINPNPTQIWNIQSSGLSGTVTITPAASWAQVIPAGGTSYSLGFCGIRPSGSGLMPDDPVVTASF